MTSRVRLAAWTLGAVLAATAVVTSPRTAWADPTEEAGKAHFKSGVGLFRDGNYAGALAEFEESFRLRPGASALQNIALCQRQLFRYAAAMGSLEKMLASYAGSLSADDKAAAEQTLKELRDKTTRVVFVVSPKDAALLVDGKVLEGAERRSMVLDVGEHRVVLSAPGFADLDRRFSIAGAEKEVPLSLSSATAKLTVVTDDPAAVVFVDGAEQGKGSWTGSVAANERHVVKVEKPGHAPTVADVILKLDEAREIKLPIGAPLEDGKPGAAKAPLTSTGFYGFGTATLYFVGQHPDGFKTVQDKPENGGYFGIRAGYRLAPRWGLELLAEGGSHTVGPGCYRYPDEPCTEASEQQPYYDLTGYRVGVGGRFFGKGNTVRLIGTGAIGLAYHVFEIKPADPRPGATGRQPAPGKGNAANAFFLGEVGAQIPIGRALVDVVAVAAIDGMSNIRVNDQACLKLEEPCNRAVYNGNKTVTMGGIGIRVGYGRW